MGQNRAPVSEFAPRSTASLAYQKLYDEMENGVVSKR
jgi:chromosome partitioning protein